MKFTKFLTRAERASRFCRIRRELLVVSALIVPGDLHFERVRKECWARQSAGKDNSVCDEETEFAIRRTIRGQQEDRDERFFAFYEVPAPRCDTVKGSWPTPLNVSPSSTIT